jgi:hypothetical protein
MTSDKHADLILHGGKLTTLDPANPSATAAAVKGDRLLGIGSVGQVLLHWFFDHADAEVPLQIVCYFKHKELGSICFRGRRRATDRTRVTRLRHHAGRRARRTCSA